MNTSKNIAKIAALFVVMGLVYFIYIKVSNPIQILNVENDTLEYEYISETDNEINREIGINGSSAGMGDKKFGYIKKIEKIENTYQMVIDYAEYKNCEPSDDCINGFDIINNNPMLRTIQISSDAVIRMKTFSRKGWDFHWDERVTAQQFHDLINGSLVPPSHLDHSSADNYINMYTSRVPFWIVIKDGQIIDVEEMFLS